MSFLTVLSSVILPIFILIGVGVALDRFFQLDLRTLGKLNFYVFVPALLFIKIFEADSQGGTLLKIVLFTAAHMSILFAVAWVLAGRGSLTPQRKMIALGAVFANAGNYGIPLVIMAFGEEYVGALAMLIVTQNVFSFTFGVWLFQKEKGGPLRVLRGMAGIPVIHAVAAALLLRWLDLGVIAQIHGPLTALADAMIPVALLTLGAQLSRSFGAKNDFLPLSVITVLRLGAGPLLAWALAPLFDFPGTIASLLIVALGLPVAVNVYILAAEYEEDEVLASQAIFWSTLLSTVTVSILLALRL